MRIDIPKPELIQALQSYIDDATDWELSQLANHVLSVNLHPIHTANGVQFTGSSTNCFVNNRYLSVHRGEVVPAAESIRQMKTLFSPTSRH
ncbi:hypothetical protein DFP78_113189 [Photobacterium lutimaris]|nr:hypothetical protein DFP78_113189 [Photobacterium lutimaris]